MSRPFFEVVDGCAHMKSFDESTPTSERVEYVRKYCAEWIAELESEKEAAQ